jgi:hypothetical protein
MAIKIEAAGRGRIKGTPGVGSWLASKAEKSSSLVWRPAVVENEQFSGGGRRLEEEEEGRRNWAKPTASHSPKRVCGLTSVSTRVEDRRTRVLARRLG